MDWSPPKLLMECEAGDRLRDQIIASLGDRMERYYGTAYGYSTGQYWPENYYYTWAAYFLPQIIFQNPRVKIGSQKLSEVVNEAIALEMAINRWIRDTDQRTGLRQLGFDMGFCYGVSFTTAVPFGTQGDKEDVEYRPQVTRLDQRLYSMDPLASGPQDARWQQHISIEDRDIMLGWVKDRPEEQWNLAAIEAAGGVQKSDLVKSESKNVPDRGQVAYRNIWCPEENGYLGPDDDPESFYGTVYTMSLHPSSSRELTWLRPPRPAFVPRWGPYTMFGAHPVAGCPYPLGSLVAVDAQLQELNALALANYKAARNRRRIGIFDETQTALAALIAKCEDGGTVGVPGFDKQHFAEAEFGGVTETGLAQEEHARNMTERMTGMSEVQQGATATGALATEVIQAVAASNVRTSDLAEQFTAAVKRQYTTVAWYMWKMDLVKVPLSEQDANAIRQALVQQGVPPEAVMQALPQGETLYWSGKGNEQPFEQLELEIEPYSMKRTDEPMMQQRAMQAIETAVSLAPLIPTAPHIRWKDLLSKLGDSMNWPGFEDILDEEVAMQMGLVALQGQVQPIAGPAQGGGDPKARLGGDRQSPAQGFPKAGQPAQRPQLPQRSAAPQQAKPAKAGAG